VSPLVLVFWGMLLVPGYAIARRLDREGVESGLPAAVALSFVAAACALGLLAIPCYYLGTPLWILSAGLVAFVAWGLVDLILARAWRALGHLALAAVGLELTIVLVDLVFSARVGTVLGADAIVHVGRVRFLLDSGLLNQDQFVEPAYFYPIYHTNILHALLASAAQITRTQPVDVWFSSLAAAKALVIAGGWYAGWAIFRSSAAAWVTALFILGARGPVTFLLYPNQVAPWFLLPVLIGYVVRAIADGPDRRHWLGIGAVALLIAMTHTLYAVFVVLSVGPVVAAWAAARWLRRADDRRAAAACVLAIAVGMPFPLITFVGMKQATATGERLRPAAADASEAPEADEEDDEADDAGSAEGLELSGLMRRFDNGWVMHKLHRGFNGPKGLRLYIVAMAGALMVLAGRRRETAVLVSVLLVVAAWLHVPPLCTLLLKAGGAEWIIHRFAMFQHVIFALMVGGSIMTIAEHATSRVETESGSRSRLALGVVRLGLGLTCIFAGAHFASQRRPYDWSSYLDRVRAAPSSRYGRELRPLQRFVADMEAHVPAGATVLAEPSIGMRAVMVRDCRVITSTSSSTGVPDLGQRRRDTRKMLRNRTPEAERQELLHEYGVTHLLLDRPARRWVYDRMREFWTTEFGWCIVALRPADEPPGEILGDYDQALADIGEHEQAIPWLERQLSVDPGHFGRRLRLGNALMIAGRYDEAIASFRLARELRPDDPRAAIMIGNAHAALECYDDAIGAYRETIAVAERTGDAQSGASAWYNLGNMYYRLGLWIDAIEAYRAALDLNPQHANARFWRMEAQRNLEIGAGPPEDASTRRPDEGRARDDDDPPRDAQPEEDDAAPDTLR
jgi:tetratricopeptide (TPR) repeat protein